MPTPLTNGQETLLSALGGTFLGYLSTFAIEWYKKRRNPKEVEVELSEKINQAASENVATTQKVIDILDARLISERVYYDDLIRRGKEDCQNQILRMKEEYDEIIEDLQTKIIRGTAENAELNRQVVNLTNDKNVLQQEVIDLKVRLKKYENGLNLPSGEVNSEMSE